MRFCYSFFSFSLSLLFFTLFLTCARVYSCAHICCCCFFHLSFKIHFHSVEMRQRGTVGEVCWLYVQFCFLCVRFWIFVQLTPLVIQTLNTILFYKKICCWLFDTNFTLIHTGLKSKDFDASRCPRFDQFDQKLCAEVEYTLCLHRNKNEEKKKPR